MYFDFSKTKISFKRPLTSYSKIRKLLSLILRNNTILMNKERINNLKYLDVGCGPNTHNNYINLDYEWGPSIDICWDITKKQLPLKKNSINGIFYGTLC